MRSKEYRKEYLKGTRRHGSYRFKLDKFLQSRLGQPWDKIHAELSSHFDRRTYAGYTFWQNIERYFTNIALHVWIGAETGTVFENSRYGDGRVDGFYVHPWTNRLCYQGPIVREPKTREITRIVIDDRHAVEKITGIWYLTEYIIESDKYRYSWYYYTHGAKQYTIKNKRQLSREELRKNNLVNNTPEEIVEIKIKEAEEEKMRQMAMEKAHGM